MTYFSIYGNVLSGKGLFKLISIIYFIKLANMAVFGYLFVAPNTFNLGARGLAMAILFSNVIMGLLFVAYSKKKIKEIIIFPGFGIILF